MSVDYSFVNSTVDSALSEMVGDHLKGVGRMFYIHSPQDTMWERKEDVPNFFKQVSTLLSFFSKKRRYMQLSRSVV